MNVVQNLLSFDRMLTPVIIRGVFIVSVIVEILIGLGLIFSGNILFGLGFLVIAPIISRVSAELTLLFFEMHERLTDVKELLKRDRAGAA